MKLGHNNFGHWINQFTDVPLPVFINYRPTDREAGASQLRWIMQVFPAASGEIPYVNEYPLFGYIHQPSVLRMLFTRDVSSNNNGYVIIHYI